MRYTTRRDEPATEDGGGGALLALHDDLKSRWFSSRVFFPVFWNRLYPKSYKEPFLPDDRGCVPIEAPDAVRDIDLRPCRPSELKKWQSIMDGLNVIDDCASLAS